MIKFYEKRFGDQLSAFMDRKNIQNVDLANLMRDLEEEGIDNKSTGQSKFEGYIGQWKKNKKRPEPKELEYLLQVVQGVGENKEYNLDTTLYDDTWEARLFRSYRYYDPEEYPGFLIAKIIERARINKGSKVHKEELALLAWVGVFVMREQADPDDFPDNVKDDIAYKLTRDLFMKVKVSIKEGMPLEKDYVDEKLKNIIAQNKQITRWVDKYKGDGIEGTFEEILKAARRAQYSKVAKVLEHELNTLEKHGIILSSNYDADIIYELREKYLSKVTTKLNKVTLQSGEYNLTDIYVPLALHQKIRYEVKDNKLTTWGVMHLDDDKDNSYSLVSLPRNDDGMLALSKNSHHDLFKQIVADRTALVTFETKLQNIIKDNNTPDGTYTIDLDSQDILHLQKYVTVVGGPGTGKSSLLKFLALCLAGEEIVDSEVNLQQLRFWPDEEKPIPIYIEFKELVPYIFPEDPTENLSHIVTSKFQDYLKYNWLFLNGIREYADKLEEMARQGKVIFLLDGLDEISDEHAFKPERGNQIKVFVNELRKHYKDCRIIISSRPIAYNTTRLKLDGFGRVDLGTLSEAKIHQLARNLFGHVLKYPKQGEVEAEIFSKQIAKRRNMVHGTDDEDLFDNPFFITLMVNIWDRNQDIPEQNRIPESLVSLYDLCIKQLVERWGEKQGDLDSALAQIGLNEDEFHRVLNQLAYIIHDEQRDTFSFGDLTNVIYNRTLRLNKIDEMALRSAIAIGTGIIVDIAPDKNNQYAFIHRSFQEFLAARHLKNSDELNTRVPTCIDENHTHWQNVLNLLGLQLDNKEDSNKFDLLIDSLLASTNYSTHDPESPVWWKLYYACHWIDTARNIDSSRLYEQRGNLTKAIEIGALPWKQRAELGHILGKVGDPRAGVGIVEPNMDDKFDKNPIDHVEYSSEDGSARIRIENGLPDLGWMPVEIPKEFDEKPIPFRDTAGHVYGEFIIPSFYVAKYPITVKQFQAFLNAEDGSSNSKWWDGFEDWHNPEPSFWDEQKDKANNPVRVSWLEAVAFTRWLNSNLKGIRVKRPFQKEGDEWIIGETAQLRLPLEWEYQWVVQNGTNEWAFSPDLEWKDNVASFNSPVGMYPQGAACGALDIFGNVEEHCLNDSDYIFDYRRRDMNDDDFDEQGWLDSLYTRKTMNQERKKWKISEKELDEWLTEEKLAELKKMHDKWFDEELLEEYAFNEYATKKYLFDQYYATVGGMPSKTVWRFGPEPRYERPAGWNTRDIGIRLILTSHIISIPSELSRLQEKGPFAK